MLGNFEEIQKMSKTNIDAMTKLFGAVPQTAQTMATEMADYSKRSFETSTKAMEKLLGVKSPVQAIEVQTEFAKTSFEDYTAKLTKFGELCSNLAKEVFKPFDGFIIKPSSARGLGNGNHN
jgi:hypothetical protein